MQTRPRESAGSKPQHFAPFKLIAARTPIEWARRIIKDPLMVVLLVWAFLFVALGLLAALA